MNGLGRFAGVFLFATGCLAGVTLAVPASAATPVAVPAVRVGVVQPRAEIEQGNSNVDLGNAVLRALVTDMSGPRVEFVTLQSHAQVQIDAEAQQAGCVYV